MANRAVHVLLFTLFIGWKQYSAKAIQERCQQKTVPKQKLRPHSAQEPIGLPPQANAFEAETKVYPNAMPIAAPFKEIEHTGYPDANGTDIKLSALPVEKEKEKEEKKEPE